MVDEQNKVIGFYHRSDVSFIIKATDTDMVLHNLNLGGGFEFGNLSRRITLGLLKDEHDRIDLQFTLAGNLEDPKFSLNEELYMRTGTALARTLGMSIEGLGKGVIGVGGGIGGALRSIVE